MWVWVLLFVFAWNDVMAFFTAPITTSFNFLLVRPTRSLLAPACPTPSR